jgi:hypothetical protein
LRFFCQADAYWADEIHVRNGKTYATTCRGLLKKGNEEENSPQ